MIIISDDTSLKYSQLRHVTSATSLRQSVGQFTDSIGSKERSILRESQSQPNLPSISVGDVSRRILRAMQKKPRKQPRTGELEREWLLLGSPQPSPRNTIILDDDEQNTTSTLTITPATGPDNTNQQQQCGDSEMRQQSVLSASSVSNDDGGSSDSSTDIDAAVDEYLQKVEVIAGRAEKVLRIPSQESFQLSSILIGCYFAGIFLCVIAFGIRSAILFGAGFVGE